MAIERPIEKFLSIYPSPSTNRTYRKMIEKFFDHVNGDEMQYFNDGRNHQDDVRKFVTSLEKRQDLCFSSSFDYITN